ncbi:MAG: hypothetical protein ACLT1W_13305 [Alistipes onderdonkii]
MEAATASRSFTRRGPEYTAAEAGPTTATSEAGIADYDASKPLTAYYPATTAEGVVAVEAERTIALDAESQSNPARRRSRDCPLRGTAEGALEVTFQYLLGHRTAYRRRGVGESGAVADRRAGREAAFEGFLSFEGIGRPETR